MTGPEARRDEWVERVRAASDIVEVVSQTVALKRVGRNYMGLCPFHGEKTPSFSVSSERQFYHCFSCKAGGDVFRFVMELEKLGFPEAVELLSRRAGIPVPERRLPGGPARAPIVEALAAAADAYEQWLADETQGRSARDHLAARGIEPETRREFRLGFAPPGWESLVRRLKGRFPDEVLIKAGLAGRKDGGRGGLFDRFRNRLMIPLIQAGGDVIGFGARALQAGDEPKYLNSPETAVYHKGSYLYGLEQARRHLDLTGEAVVVEGYFDALALHQAGIRHVVASSGTALTADHVRILRRYTGRIALAYDGDAAGREAVARSLGVILKEGLDVVVVDLPAGEDPDTLVRTGGAAAWEERRRTATGPVETLERHSLRAGSGKDPREAAVQEVVRMAASLSDPVKTGLLLERAAAVFGMELETLRRAVALRTQGQVSSQPVSAALAAQRRERRGIEVDVLRALLQDRESFAEIERLIGPEDFHDPVVAHVVRWLWAGGGGSPEDAGAAALTRELMLPPEGEYRWREVARGGAHQLVIRRLKERRREAQNRLREAASANEQLEAIETVRLLSQDIEEHERSLREL